MGKQNDYAQPCYLCRNLVLPRQGMVQRHAGRWLVVHHKCAADRKRGLETQVKD